MLTHQIKKKQKHIVITCNVSCYSNTFYFTNWNRVKLRHGNILLLLSTVDDIIKKMHTLRGIWRRSIFYEEEIFRVWTSWGILLISWRGTDSFVYTSTSIQSQLHLRQLCDNRLRLELTSMTHAVEFQNLKLRVSLTTEGGSLLRHAWLPLSFKILTLPTSLTSNNYV